MPLKKSKSSKIKIIDEEPPFPLVNYDKKNNYMWSKPSQIKSMQANGWKIAASVKSIEEYNFLNKQKLILMYKEK